MTHFTTAVPVDNIELRSLVKADLNEVATVHCAAFPCSILTRLGSDIVRRYYEWQLEAGHPVLSAIGVFSDTQLVGFAFGGVFRDAVNGFARRNALALGLALLRRPWVGARRVAVSRIVRLLRLIAARPFRGHAAQVTGRSPSIKSYAVLSIATEPSRSGSGIGSRLLRKLEDDARARGFDRMHLTVHPSNTAAIRFYRKQGWSTPVGSGVEASLMERRLHDDA